MKLLSDLTDEELISLDDKCHTKSHIDENLINHMDIMVEMEARGLPHTDESILTKATKWWMENNSRFTGLLKRDDIKQYLPKVSLIGALRYRDTIGPNEYVDVAVSDNNEAMQIVKDCSRPEIITRLRFNTEEKPYEVPLRSIPAYAKLNDLWHNWAYKKISKGLFIFKSLGNDIYIRVTPDSTTIFGESGIDITRLHPTILKECTELTPALYYGEINGNGSEYQILDYDADGKPETYIERYTKLVEVCKRVPQFIPVSAVSSLTKSMDKDNNYYVFDPNSNDTAFVFKPAGGILMISCKFNKSDDICPLRKSDITYPVECEFSDSYVCPYIKEIYYEDN